MSITISGLVAMVLTQVLGDTVSSEQVADFIEVSGLIISAVWIWYGRFRQGDITFWGGKNN